MSLVASRFAQLSPTLSPDGRWLAYRSNETGRFEVYVVPFPNAGSARWPVSNGGGTEPLWSRRGGELFYRDGIWNMVAVEVTTTPTLSTGRSTVLFPAAGLLMSAAACGYDVTQDGRRFLMIRSVGGGGAGQGDRGGELAAGVEGEEVSGDDGHET